MGSGDGGVTIGRHALVGLSQIRERHIFGDLKLDIFDSNGQLLTSLQGDKRAFRCRQT